MSCLHPLDDTGTLPPVPERFPSPLLNTPDPLAQYATKALQQRLPEWVKEHDFFAPGGGKMLGVLVLRERSGALAYAAAFSGMLGGAWHCAGFVPPVFDVVARNALMSGGERQLAELTQVCEAIEHSPERQQALAHLAQQQAQAQEALAVCQQQQAARKAERRALRARTDLSPSQAVELARQSQRDSREFKALRKQWAAQVAEAKQRVAAFEASRASQQQARKALSAALQRQLFEGYQVSNWQGERATLGDLFEGLPPSGAGDCAAPKLLHYAHQHGLQPLALAEFWWGAPPPSGVRRHGHFYATCRSKCGPLLPFMLRGLALQADPGFGQHMGEQALPVVYEDAHILVVNKPAGLLSVPGKRVEDSVLTRLRARCPQSPELRLVHRLDMSTSGLLVAAKHPEANAGLHRQFEQRKIYKRYQALLAGQLSARRGNVRLPLRVDLEDRPRQLVCWQHGKPAWTHWKHVAESVGQTRVYFYPKTGRTHQLRVHAAHSEGLDAPIVGDELYGIEGPRLCLHAESLRLKHPISARTLTLHAPVPF